MPDSMPTDYHAGNSLELNDVQFRERNNEFPSLVTKSLMLSYDGVGISPGQHDYVVGVLLINYFRRVYREVEARAEQV